MSVWHINGGNSLRGSITVQGAKNAVLPVLAASVLAPCRTELLNVPELSDVETTAEILRRLGCAVSREDDTMEIDSTALTGCAIPHELMTRLRSSVIFLGALLARCGEARVSLPGGCELGPRPVDMHIAALRSLGAEVEERGGELICRADGLRGAEIDFRTPSVGATENAMLAACAAKGTTVIHNAAREPEIEELQSFLRALGARIYGAGSPTVTVDGFEPLSCVGHRVMPDRIVASTFLAAAAAAGGDIELRGVEPRHFRTMLLSLSQAGCDIIPGGYSVILRSTGRLRAPEPVFTGPYPSFATDAMPPLLAACLRAEGTSVFVENVFNNRFRFIGELQRLGARVRTTGSVAVVTGVDELIGAPATAPDLRGGAAILTAALGAAGETVLYDTEGHIARGYDRFDERLRSIGADVWLE